MGQRSFVGLTRGYHLDLNDEETRALLNLLVETIEADRFPYSPRIRVLRDRFSRLTGNPWASGSSHCNCVAIDEASIDAPLDEV